MNSATPRNPIPAAEPLMVWAARKLAFIASVSSGWRSRLRSPSFELLDERRGLFDEPSPHLARGAAGGSPARGSARGSGTRLDALRMPYGHTRFTAFRSCSVSNGFTIQPVAPAAWPAAPLVAARLRRQHQDRGELVGWLRANLFDQMHAIKVGHIDVGDDEVNFLPTELVQRIAAVHRLDHVVAGLCEGVGSRVAAC